MKKYIVSILLAMLMGIGFTLELPEESTVTVTTEAGVVVGFGELDDGRLELSISEEAEGFLTLTFTNEEGQLVTVEVMVTEEGTLVVVDTLTELGEEVAAGGGSSEISFVSSAEITEELEEELSEDLEEELEEVLDREDGLDVADAAAGENGAEGRATAREARDTARDARDNRGAPVGDEAEGSEDGDVEGEVEIEIEIEIEIDVDDEDESEDEDEDSEEEEADVAVEAEVAGEFVVSTPGAR